MDQPIDIPGFEELAELEYVDAAVFEASDAGEQAVCDFVLGLALIYNDLKDLMWSFIELKDRTPTVFAPTPQIGQVNGMREHAVRLLYGLHHEIFLFIQHNPSPRAHPLFTAVIGRLSKKDREHWDTLVDIASGKPKTNPLAMMLVRVRNELAFHYYELDGLVRGFKKYYGGTSPTGRKLYVSRGTNILGTRFHFADGAAQGTMLQLADGKTKKELGDRLGALTESTLHAAGAIVTRFMEDRARGWSKDKAP